MFFPSAFYILFYVTVRKAYHKLSLVVHPDRVDENKKLEATEKFKVLGHVHSILSDTDKRQIYDETGLPLLIVFSECHHLTASHSFVSCCRRLWGR